MLPQYCCMEANCTYLSYEQTNYFSNIVTDYINADARLQPFYKHAVSIVGIQKAIEARRQFPQRREILVAELEQQYKGLLLHNKLKENLQLLKKENTFTVTTAHQPNIFTGPLYFVYKILHAIKLAQDLQKDFADCNFVPVYYMGSEDADLDEIGTINIDGVTYKWNTSQTGAVGRMKVDAAFLQMIAQMRGQLGVLPFGNELTDKFEKVYTKGKTIQQATLELVNDLFGEYGLVVLIPDNENLKRLFIPVVEKELTENFSHTIVNETIAELEKHYKVQAGGREINLFYLRDDRRERIEFENGNFTVDHFSLRFTKEEILKELNEHPDRFSANVILRGAFQETVLPNIAFIGGGGELAYWLELKNVFEAVNIPYPVLILRNSFLLIESKLKQIMNELGIDDADVFQSTFSLMNLVVEKSSINQFKLNGELKKVQDLYEHINNIAGSIDKTLQQHVAALQTKAIQKLAELEKKMLRAEKRKFEAEQRKISKLKSALFPHDNLQERVENMAYFYASYGNRIIQLLLNDSKTIDASFTVLSLQ